jgi:hypothetical protein
LQVKNSSKAETPASTLKRERAGPVVKVIQLPRANNISIMLTQVTSGRQQQPLGRKQQLCALYSFFNECLGPPLAD